MVSVRGVWIVWVVGVKGGVDSVGGGCEGRCG